MPIIKKSRCECVTASKDVCVCNDCGYTSIENLKKCPKCNADMIVVSSSASSASSAASPKHDGCCGGSCGCGLK